MSYTLELFAVDLEAVRKQLISQPELEPVLPNSTADGEKVSDAWYELKGLDVVRRGRVNLSTWDGVHIGNGRVKGKAKVLNSLLWSRPPFEWRPAKSFPIVGHLSRAEIIAAADKLTAFLEGAGDGAEDEELESVIELAEAVVSARDGKADLLSFFY